MGSEMGGCSGGGGKRLAGMFHHVNKLLLKTDPSAELKFRGGVSHAEHATSAPSGIEEDEEWDFFFA